MRPSWNTGLNFGLTSGVLTTLGLIVGLYAGTHSRTAVLGGILTIAIADSLSDAMGIHLAEESKNTGAASHVWEATMATFLAKFGTALTFAVPLAMASLSHAILISVMWGLSLVAVLSFLIARAQGISPWTVVGEHLLFTLCVVTLSHYVGEWVRRLYE
jgi:VIT1/CCC1 family predicted Fe2+/Mn2+ transporter